MNIKLNYHLFGDDGRGTAPLNVNWTGQTGAGQDLSPEMKTFYDRALLKCAEPALVHDQFGQKRPIPKGSGKTIEFRKFSSLPKALTPLTEGVTPVGQKYNVTAITATVAQYGAYIGVSDMLQLTAFDNNMAEITRILGSQAGRTSDTLTRDVLAGGLNVIYADNGTSGTPDGNNEPGDLGSDDVLTVNLIQKAVRFLKRNNAQTINGDFVAIVHPDTVYDLWQDEKWEEASKYAGSTQIFKGEVGRLYGVRFVETTEAKIWPANDAHGNTVADYGTLVLGADAFGVTSIANGGIETIAKQLGSGGTADPLNQRATIGWKLNKVAKILAEEFMVRVEHATSYGSDPIPPVGAPKLSSFKLGDTSATLDHDAATGTISVTAGTLKIDATADTGGFITKILEGTTEKTNGSNTTLSAGTTTYKVTAEDGGAEKVYTITATVTSE